VGRLRGWSWGCGSRIRSTGRLSASAFDGSETNDWTALGAETIDGYSFTPRYGPDERPAVWDPAEWNGRIPRGEVRAAIDEVMSTYTVARMYCDPQDWRTEIGEWALAYGPVVFEWATNRTSQMYEAIRTFEVDLATGRIEHDDCPIARTHIANARKVAKPGQKYILGKPADHQKIDVAMARILAHEAKNDALAAGWGKDRRALTRVSGRVRSF
jgi:hypothetical protein